MDDIEIYSLIVKDLARVPYSRSISSLVKDLFRLGWSYVPSYVPSISLVFIKYINNEVWQLHYDKDLCLKRVDALIYTVKTIDFLSWAGEVYCDVALNGRAALRYPAPKEVFCDQVAAAVLRYWVPEQRPKPILVQEVHESFEKFLTHTDFTNLDQIGKVLYMLAIHLFDPLPNGDISLERAYLQADLDSDIDNIYKIYSGWAESVHVRSNLNFTSIQVLKYMRDSWFVPEDCGECLRLLSLM